MADPPTDKQVRSFLELAKKARAKIKTRLLNPHE
jgi:hypothetical protein